MCDAGILTISLLAASSALGAYSYVQAGKAEREAMEYNARIAEMNAQALEDDKYLASEQAANERRRLAERMRGERGEAKARAVAMGLDPNMGSPADLIGDIERAYKIDRDIMITNENTTLKNIDQQQADYRANAGLSRMRGKSAEQAGYMGALGSLLDGAAAVSSRWIQPKAPAPTTTPEPGYSNFHFVSPSGMRLNLGG